MTKITKWISGVFRKNDKEAQEPTSRQPDVPALPSQRKHILTQNSSYQNHPKPNNVFFTRFPREVRDQIYIAAFGNRTLHIDLQWKQPDLPDHSDSKYLVHACVADVGRDLSARHEWAWWSSVCHRHLIAEPWNDKCQSGSSRELCNHFYSGDDCFLGVMGWLMSCRQA